MAIGKAGLTVIVGQRHRTGRTRRAVPSNRASYLDKVHGTRPASYSLMDTHQIDENRTLEEFTEQHRLNREKSR
jgi:hypothetical protein